MPRKLEGFRRAAGHPLPDELIVWGEEVAPGVRWKGIRPAKDARIWTHVGAHADVPGLGNVRLTMHDPRMAPTRPDLGSIVLTRPDSGDDTTITVQFAETIRGTKAAYQRALRKLFATELAEATRKADGIRRALGQSAKYRAQQRAAGAPCPT